MRSGQGCTHRSLDENGLFTLGFVLELDEEDDKDDTERDNAGGCEEWRLRRIDTFLRLPTGCVYWF